MKIRTIKLSKALDAELTRYAAAKGESASAVLREALAEYLGGSSRDRPRSPRATVGELAADLAGSIDGPSDLSTHPKYLKGFGRAAR